MIFPFETMTAQEVFDKVVEHLLTQNARSCAADQTCAYRGERGLMCAAGCLIPDDQYDESMEGIDWLKLDLSDAHRDLIDNLQSVHDGIEVAYWKEHLRDVARDHKLEFKFNQFIPREQT